MLTNSTKFLIILLNINQVTRKSPTKFSDIQTLLKSLPDNLPAEQILLQQANSEKVLKIKKTSVMIIPLDSTILKYP